MALALSAPATSGEDGPMLTDPGSLQWRHRLVVVFAADEASATAAQDTLAGAGDPVLERDILWFVVRDETTRTNYAGTMAADFAVTLRQAYRGPPAGAPTEVVLVGKDGGVKSRGPTLDPAALFGEIDRMPMRRQEMRER
jgi:hypothetical protein